MAAELFDMELRALRRDRAASIGPALFLHERAFDDVLERLSVINRQFQSALLVGCPDPQWPSRLRQVVDAVDIADPGRLFAAAAGGRCIVEERMELEAGAYDICIAIGTLDSVNELPTALGLIRRAMRPDGLLIGAISGGDTLPALRSAMRAADEVEGAASPHVHPRIDPPSLCMLLTAAGFAMPVVDVDRVEVGYRGLPRLVADLRAMGATNLLRARSKKALSRAAYAAAQAQFSSLAEDGRTVERFELLHFAAWTGSDATQMSKG